MRVLSFFVVGILACSLCTLSVLQILTIDNRTSVVSTHPLQSELSLYVSRHYTNDLSVHGMASKGRYLIFAVGDEGLGNKLLPLVSAFFLAFITDRTFFVHWTGSEAVHNTPMFIDELYKPPDGMQWDFEHIARLTLSSGFPRLHELYAAFNSTRVVTLQHIRGLFNELHLSMEEIDMRTADYGMVKERAMCEDWRERYRNTSAILVYGDQYFVPPLQTNHHYRSLVTRWFNDTDIYGPIARWLLRPSNAVNTYITAFMKKHFTPFTVGLQLRRRERLGLRDEEVTLALDCARDIARDHNNTSFFVASDDNNLRHSLSERLKDVGPVSFTSEFLPREDMTRGLFFAVVDSLLLAHTRSIIVTPSSTFGYISHAYGSLVPWRAALQPASKCHHAQSAEPSAHFWQPLMREATHMCIDKDEFATLLQQEECCPRWFR